MQRYDFQGDTVGAFRTETAHMEEAENGEYVLFTDHQAALSALETENRRLRGHVTALLKAIDEQDYYNDSVFEPAREALKEKK